MARPKPRAAPVTRATWPVKSNCERVFITPPLRLISLCGGHGRAGWWEVSSEGGVRRSVKIPLKSDGLRTDPSPALLRRAPSPVGEGCDVDFSASPLGGEGSAPGIAQPKKLSAPAIDGVVVPEFQPSPVRSFESVE